MKRAVETQKRVRLAGYLKQMPTGMIVCQVYFALYLLSALLYAALCPPAKFAYDLSLVRAVLIASSSAVSLWLLGKRWHGARVVALASVLLCMMLSAVDSFGLGSVFDAARIVSLPIAISMTALEFFGAGFVSYALLFDRELRDVLTVEFDTKPAHNGGHSWDVPMHERVRTWEFWRDLFIYFIVFSFLGHWAEMLFCRLIVAGVFMGDYDPSNAMLWDQWLFPFSAEGTALAAVVVVLHPLAYALQKRFGERSLMALGLSFLANTALCTSIDFITGITCNREYQLWDYRKLPFNFMGQVCLQNSMVYSIAATIIVWVVYPAMDSGIRRLPKAVADGLFWALAGAYGFLALLHFVDPSMMVG